MEICMWLRVRKLGELFFTAYLSVLIHGNNEIADTRPALTY